MRILMFSSFFPPQYSGAAKQAVSLAKQLRRLDVHVEFATMHDAGQPKFEIFEGFPVHRIEVDGRRNQEFPFWLNFFKFALKHKNQFDILHSHGSHYINSIIGPIAKTLGWRSLVKATMSNNDLKGLKKSASGVLHYLFLKSVNAYIAISSDLVKEFKGHGFNEDHIHYIPNGVDTIRFCPVDPSKKTELRQRLNLPVDRRIVLSVGVFDRRKNIGWLIKEWENHKGFGTDNFLLAIGPQSREDQGGRFLSSLKKIVSNNGQDMMLLDHVQNIEEYYQATDIFVLTSTNEGLPNVVLEAMASGLPCVATRARGTSDLIEEGVTGILFHHNSNEQLSDRLLHIDVAGIEKMGAAAREMVLERFSINTIAKMYAGLYKKILQ